MRLVDPGGFLRRAYDSSWHPFELDQTSQAVVDFPEAVSWASPARVTVAWGEPSALDTAGHLGFSPEHLDADVVGDRGNWSLPWRNGETRPRVQQLATQQAPRNAAVLEIRGHRRYVGVCAWSASGRLPRIRARRSDTHQFVGAKAPELPVFAVMTDRFATIQLELAAANAAELDDVRLIAVTADDPPILPLFLETLGNAFAPLQMNGVTADASAHRRAGRWLQEAFAIRMNSVDVAAIAAVDRELGAILTSLNGDLR
jgi:hypothetical protein